VAQQRRAEHRAAPTQAWLRTTGAMLNSKLYHLRKK